MQPRIQRRKWQRGLIDAWFNFMYISLFLLLSSCTKVNCLHGLLSHSELGKWLCDDHKGFYVRSNAQPCFFCLPSLLSSFPFPYLCLSIISILFSFLSSLSLLIPIFPFLILYAPLPYWQLDLTPEPFT